MKKLLLVLLITSSFFIGCGEKRDTNENKELEQKYEKMHRAKWKERQKEKGNSYTYRDYQKEEIQKELDNPTYKIVSLEHCDIPVRDFVELKSETTNENRVWLYYFIEDVKNRLVQYDHLYHIVLRDEDKTSYLNMMYDLFEKNKELYSYNKYVYEGFQIYTKGPIKQYVGSTYYLYGNSTSIEIGMTTEREIKYMIDYCNKTKKEEF